jgi:hypothetical protein
MESMVQEVILIFYIIALDLYGQFEHEGDL